MYNFVCTKDKYYIIILVFILYKYLNWLNEFEKKNHFYVKEMRRYWTKLLKIVPYVI